MVDYYETEVLTATQLYKFRNFIDTRIGVDYEVNRVDDGQWYVLVFELEPHEVLLCMEFEKGI